MNLRTLIAVACALAAPIMSTQSAHALKNVTIPATTTSTYVGMVSGDAWAAHLRPAGCLWTKLGENGLDQETWVNGLSTDDRIYAVTTTTTVCNFTMTPVVTQGFKLVFWGQGGNDILVGSIKASNNGGDGHDITWTDRPSASDNGGSGNDTMFSSTSTVYMFGQSGDDALCTMEQGEHIHVQRMSGGTHSVGDTACGLAHEYVGIEFRNTSPQCPAECAVF